MRSARSRDVQLGMRLRLSTPGDGELIAVHQALEEPRPVQPTPNRLTESTLLRRLAAWQRSLAPTVAQNWQSASGYYDQESRRSTQIFGVRRILGPDTLLPTVQPSLFTS
jgi:hypothetical protein